MLVAIEIINLSHKPDLLSTIARWQHEEWLHNAMVNKNTYLDGVAVKTDAEKRLALFDGHLGFESIPVTFIACSGDTPIGCVSLIRYDSKPYVCTDDEWLTNLYVEGEYRKQGVANKLVQHLCEYAKKIGLKKMHLYSNGMSEFYRKLGWIEEAQVPVNGNDLSLFSKVLI